MVSFLKYLTAIASVLIMSSVFGGKPFMSWMNFDLGFDEELPKALREGKAKSFDQLPLVENLQKGMVEDVKVTIISDVMSGGNVDGNPGFSAFIEIDVDGTEANKKYILFDTTYADRILDMVKDLSTPNKKTGKAAIPNFAKFKDRQIEVILSHWHEDHIQGFPKLKAKFPHAFGKVHVGKNFFKKRLWTNEIDKKTGEKRVAFDGANTKEKLREWYDKIGVGTVDDDFVEHDSFSEIFRRTEIVGERRLRVSSGVWVTGFVPRNSGETNFPKKKFEFIDDGEVVDDIVPDDMAFVANTKKGLVVVTGCGHSGLINILNWSYQNTGQEKVYGVVGGLHMRTADRNVLAEASQALSKYNVKYLVGSHCTGTTRIAALQNKLTGLDSNSAYIGSPGMSLQVKVEKGEHPVKHLVGWDANQSFPHTH